MTNRPSDFCPYKGLQPYTEQDRAFFFGRERDQRIIVSNLYASALTVFYGASGVGKSSVLLAGAVPSLAQERNLSVVVFRNWQDPGFLSQLKQKTLAAVSNTARKEFNVDLSLPLDDFLVQLSQAARGSVFFIFDQFEEYFLYNPPGRPSAETFEAEFARVINRRDVDAHFLLSMREDGLSKLDRFQGRIPTLLNNMLRLEHLNREGAQAAITKPLDVYNQGLTDGQAAVTIEPELVESILEDLRGVKVTSEQAGQGAVSDSQTTKQACEIETPLLQMVLTRLWEQELAESSHQLRLRTFEKLGRAANIARTHLDNMMDKLSDAESADAARVLRYMVTPSGTKIAQEVAALASWTELSDAQVQAILTRLGEPDMRILRTIQAPGEALRYEIFHDVLAQAILDWRRRYDALRQEERIRQEAQERIAQEQEDAERRREKERSRTLRRAFSGLLVVLVIMAGLLAFAFWQMFQARKARKGLNDKIIAEKQRSENVRLAGIHIRNGQTHLQKKRYDAAIREFDEAIKLDPSNPSPYHQKGYAYVRAEQIPDAIKTLQELTTKVDPSYPFGHFTLALAYQRSGDTVNALKEAKTALDVNPAFCENFKKDPAYDWFVKSPDYDQRCVKN